MASTARPYRSRTRPERSAPTRARIMQAVRQLLAEGAFHETSVEEVARRAGVARATVYQHFRSRLDLVDAMCDTFAENPALVAIRDSVVLADPEEALATSIALVVEFWSSEDDVLRQLYGVAAIDPAARDLVARQRDDRRGEMERLARRVGGGRRTLALLMLLTSYESYLELKQLGYGDEKVTRTLHDAARAALGLNAP